MNSKSQLPTGYVELKSLVADLKSFHLEEYVQKQQDRKKLNSVYNELQSYYAKKLTQIISQDEDICIIDKLWDKLDQSIQNREAQLEQAILKFVTLFTWFIVIFVLVILWTKFKMRKDAAKVRKLNKQHWKIRNFLKNSTRPIRLCK